MKVRVRVLQGDGCVMLNCETSSSSYIFAAGDISHIQVHDHLGELRRAACIVEHLRCGSTHVADPQTYVVDFDGREAVAVRRVT